MRKQKKVDVQISEDKKRTVTIKELIVGDLWRVLEEVFTDEGDVTLKDAIDRLLPLACNLKAKDLLKFAPSDIEMLIKEFEEVNASFFRLWKKGKNLGLLNVFQSLVVSRSLSGALPISSEPGTQGPGDTAGASSATQ